MSKCSDAEATALKEAGPLLRFAAERKKDLDTDLSLAIAEAQAAAETDQWNPQVAQRFWSAFSKLNDLILPVTMDGIAAASRTIQPRKWIRFGRTKDKISLAERSSGRYLFVLFTLLLLFIVPIQLYVWSCTILSKKIDDLFAANHELSSRLGESYRKLLTADQLTPDQQKAAEQVRVDAASINADVDRMMQQVYFLETISTLNHMYRNYFATETGKQDAENIILPEAVNKLWQEAYENAKARLSDVRVTLVKVQERATLAVGILVSFILPILFGAIGAVAYVIRTISDQIKTTTFSQSSPIRHIMRVALGALAGVVVGLFGGIASQLNQISLPPLAVAFLAGYGVEAVFSIFDGLVDKFRQGKPDAKNPA